MIAALLDWKGWTPSTRRLAFGLLVGMSLPICSALIAGAMDTYLHVRAPSMTFLVGVILAAIWFGRHVGLATALFAFFIYNFYLTEPRNTFGFAGFEDVLTLLVFMSTALLIGGLTGNLRDERERAQERVRIFSGLFTVSRRMAEPGMGEEALALLAMGTREIAAREVAVFGISGAGALELDYADPDQPPPQHVYHAALRLSQHAGSEATYDASEGWRFQLVQAAGRPIAVLAWLPMPAARSAEHLIAVRLLAELTGNAVERTQLMHRQVEMDAMARTDRLRNALMSSMSHDFRTPLSAILASASSLQTYGDAFSAATRADLLTSIQEEAERLNRFVGNILDMTKLDAGVLRPREELVDPVEVIDDVATRLQKRLAGRTFVVDAPAAAPSIRVDRLLLEQAIVNLIENALVHTPAHCAIRLGADYSGDIVRFWVEDDGPGVPASDLTRIFDKFHRLDSPQNTQGAGLGLAISKGFVEAMHGTIKATSVGGLRIELSFPRQTNLANA